MGCATAALSTVNGRKTVEVGARCISIPGLLVEEAVERVRSGLLPSRNEAQRLHTLQLYHNLRNRRAVQMFQWDAWPKHVVRVDARCTVVCLFVFGGERAVE